MWEIKPRSSLVSSSMAFEVTDGEKKFGATSQEDAEWLATALDEVTNTVVKLFCQNKTCKGFGGYITRTASDAKKSMFTCDDCGKPMTRKAFDEPEEPKPEPRVKPLDAREKQAAPVSGRIPSSVRMSAAASRGDGAGKVPVLTEQMSLVTGGTVPPPFDERQMAFLASWFQAVQNKFAAAVTNAVGELVPRVENLETEWSAMGESFQATLQMIESLTGAQKT